MQIAGSVVPAVLMIFAFPIMRVSLSAESFATFAFLFTATSFMGVLDAGLGRSVTYFAARYLHSGRPDDAMQSLWAAMAGGVVLSSVALACVLCLDSLIPSRHDSSGVDFHVLVKLLWFLPVFTCGSLLRGFLEAEQRFLALNSAQLVYGSAIAFAPLAVVRFTDSVAAYPIVFGTARLGLAAVYLLLIWRTQRKDFSPGWHCMGKLREVAAYAKWLFVSNLVGIGIVYSDRVIVAAKFIPELVSAYIVPMEFVLRGQLLIGALSTVLFPALVRMPANRSAEMLRTIISAQTALFGVLLLLSAIFCGLVPFTLSKWMGAAFSSEATFTVRVAILGLAAIGCASLTLTVLNAKGQTARPAALHSIEFPLYAGALLLSAQTGQLIYIVLVWLGRVCFDMAGTQWLLLSEHPKRAALWFAQQTVFFAIICAYCYSVWKGHGIEEIALIGLGTLGAAMAIIGARSTQRQIVP